MIRELLVGVDPVWLATCSSLVGGLVGLLVGNRLALGRDRRTRLLAAIDPVHDKLVALQANLLTSRSAHPTASQLALIDVRFGRRAGRKYRRAMAEYQRQHERQRPHDVVFGAMSYEDPPAVERAVAGLLEAIRLH